MKYNTKVLIVEDEIIVALDLKSVILKLGYGVTDIATSYEEALLSVRTEEPAIIFMDINLKGKRDGIDTVESIKRIKNIPIIYLTAFCDDETMDRAITTSPVAYMSKPFKRDDIKSTILLSLYKVNQPNQLNIDKNCEHIGLDYYYDNTHENLYYKNTPIKLSMKENILLKILIEAKGAIVPFQQLEYEIWPHDLMSGSSLRTLTYRLRTKLEYRLIENVPSFGSKLTAIL